MNIEITEAGYEHLRKWNSIFAIEYRIDGMMSAFPMYVEVIAESEEDAKTWIRKKHPEYIISE